MKKNNKGRRVFLNLISYDWDENFLKNKDIIADEYMALILNGSSIMAVVLIINIVFNYGMNMAATTSYYLAALPILFCFIGFSYYSYEHIANFVLSRIAVYVFALFTFFYSIYVHMRIDDFGQHNLTTLFIYIMLYPLLIVEKPVPKLIFSFFISVITGMIIFVNYTDDPRTYVIMMSNLLVATITSYLFGCYTTWQKLRGFSRLKKEAYVSEHDEATGLRNRRKFFQDFERYEEESGVIGVIVIDINDFKQINDTYGHLVGDEAIYHIAQILKSFGTDRAIRFYRYGGDEFVGIVTKRSGCDPNDVMEAVKKCVNEKPFITTDFGRLTLSISTGTAINNGEYTVEHLINIADERMYEDKQRYKMNKG